MSSSSCLATPASSAFTITSPSSLSLPTPSTFIKRNGTRLTLDGAPWKAVGPNLYWLGLDENVVPNPSWPGKGRVLEAMAVASAMGATTIRSTTLGVSVGTALSVQPSLGVFNEEAFAAIDWAVWAAKSYGLRLLIPLTDQYDYYHGGIPTFLRFRNLSSTDFAPFYDINSAVFSDFKAYISALLTNRSNITGLTMAEEPTIFALETGNELGGWSGSDYPPPAEWTTSIADYLKELAPDTLVVDGSYGVRKSNLNIANVDIYSDHYYPPYSYNLKRASSLASSHSKAFLVGEFDWTNKYYQPLVYLAVLIPAFLAASIWLLPARWWPWHLSLGCCCCRRDRRRRGAYTGVDSPSLAFKPFADSNTSFPPTPLSLPPPPRRNILDRTLLFRRWHLSLLVLLLSPVLAGIIYSFLPTPLPAFLSAMEDLSTSSSLAGSFYWSLFGRDDTCCAYVPHYDGYTLHYPVGNDGDGARVVELTKHAWKVRGGEPGWAGTVWATLGGEGMPRVACPQEALAVPVESSWTGGTGGAGT